MGRWQRSGLARPFGEEEGGAQAEEDETATADSPADSAEGATEADYAFEGYSVEFIDKVALLPVATAPAALAPAPSPARKAARG